MPVGSDGPESPVTDSESGGTPPGPRHRPRPTSVRARAAAITLAAVLLVAGGAAAAILDGGPGRVTATGTIPSGSTFEPIPEAVVRSDDRTIVVNGDWGGCRSRPHLVALESPAVVILAMVEPPVSVPSGAGCSLDLFDGQFQTKLRSPLGSSSLIDQSDDRPIVTVHESAMARVTVLPAGFRLSAIAPGAQIGLADGQPASAATRTCTGPASSNTPLGVVQFPGTSASDGATGLGAEVAVDVGGSPGIFQAQVDPTTGAPVASSLSWSKDGWVFVLVSWQPLGEAVLVSVAAGVVPTETAPPGASAGW